MQINLLGFLLIGAIGYSFGWFARKKFEELFPDLVAILERENNETTNNCS